MKNVKIASLWEAKSQLPLVQSQPGAGEHATRDGSRMLAETHCSDFGVHLPNDVLASIFHENYKRRTEEAREAAEPVRASLFTDPNDISAFAPASMKVANGDSLAHDPEYNQLVSRFLEFKINDADHHARLGERVDNYLDNVEAFPFDAYEIFVRRCDKNELFGDVSFANSCMKAIVSRRKAAVYGGDDNTKHYLPKLTRTIKADNIEPTNSDKYAVVTDKVEVGIFYEGDEKYTLKSRKAGAFLIDKYDLEHAAILDVLDGHNRSLGVTEELDQARTDLRELMQREPKLVIPVVESIYVARDSEVN